MKKLVIILIVLFLADATYAANEGVATVTNLCGKRITVLRTSPNGGARKVSIIYPGKTQAYIGYDKKIYNFALKKFPKSTSCTITAVKGQMHRMKFTMQNNVCACGE